MNIVNPRTGGRPGRLAIVDLLAMITLAIGVGLATAIVLGGAVLLFSSNDTSTIGSAAAMRAETIPVIRP
jgi:hypothetical protein